MKILCGFSRLVQAGFAVPALCLLLLAGCAGSETRHEPSFQRGLIWRVDGAGEKPSYLFGTFHSPDARLRALPPAVLSAFDAAEIVAFELDESRLDEAELAKSVQLPPGRRLEDILGPTLFRRAADMVAPMGVPAEGLQRLKPWALLSLFLAPAGEALRPAADGQALDYWLQAEARRRGKTVYGLETAAEQIAIFEEMTEADQVAMVTQIVNRGPEMKEKIDRMLDAYLAGDETTLMAEAHGRMSAADAAMATRLYQRAIRDRNRVMVERMLPLMAQDATFVAVGAAHLPGAEGIVRLLQREGFAVTRLD